MPVLIFIFISFFRMAPPPYGGGLGRGFLFRMALPPYVGGLGWGPKKAVAAFATTASYVICYC